MNRLRGIHNPIFTSLLFKTFVTVTLVITTVIALIGVFSYKFISSHFNHEIVRFNTEMLEYLKKSTDDRIFLQTNSIALELLVKNAKNEDIHFFADNPLRGNYDRIPPAFDTLKSILLRDNNILDSISLYYRDNDIVLSTSDGLKILNGQKVSPFYNAQWIDTFFSIPGPVSSIWMRESQNSADTGRAPDTISIIRGFPFNTNADHLQLLVSIDIKEAAIRDIFQKSVQDGFNKVLLVDRNGEIIFQMDKDTDENSIRDKPYFVNIVNKDSTNFITTIEGVETVICSLKSSVQDWYYIYMIPVAQYYQKTFLIKQIVFAICITSLLAAIILLNLVTYKMANPFIKLARNALPILKSQASEPTGQYSEFSILDKTIHVLSHKVSSLEEVIDRNRPMIAHTFYSDLLHKRVRHREEIDQKLQFLNHSFNQPFFNVILVQFNITIINTYSVEASEYILYDFAERINLLKQSFKPVILDKYRIAVIVNTPSTGFEDYHRLVCDFNRIILEKYHISAHFGIGFPYERISDISLSFEGAKNAVAYAFIHPDMLLFDSRVTSSWDLNHQYNLLKINTLSEHIHSCKLKKVYALLDEIRASIIGEKLSYRLYAKIIEVLLLTLEKSAEVLGIQLSEVTNAQKLSRICSTNYITDLFASLETVCSDLVAYNLSRHSNLYEKYVAGAKEYILQNIHRDIPLDLVAQNLQISSSYLCKIFKEIEAVNFTDYITQQRIEKSKELLLTSGKPVNSVAEAVGFSNSSYFIKKFKEINGITPSQFRRNT